MHCRGAQLLGFRDIKLSHILEKCLHRQVRSISYQSRKPDSSVSQGSVHSDELKRVTTVTEQLLNAAARSRVLPASGWKHKKSLRGEEKRLEKDVRAAGSPRRPPTKQLATWQEAAVDSALELDETDESRTTDIPALGTYVDIRRDLTSASGIVLGHALVDNRNYILSLTLSGDILSHFVADIFFEIPQMVPRDLAERAGIAPSPTRTEVSARVEILRRLREVERRLAQSYCAIGSRNIALYPLVRSPNSNEWSTVTVPQAAELISGPKNMDYYNLLATHRYLMNHTVEFVPHSTSHRTVQVWAVRPQSHVDKLVIVRDLIHQSSPAIDSFTLGTKSLPRSWIRIYGIHKRIVLIIDVLHHSLHRRRHIRADPYSPVVTTILKKLEVAEVINTAVLHQVLVDLGHLAPWDDLVSRWSELDLDHTPDEKSAKVVTEDRIVQMNLTKMTLTNSRNNTPLGPEDLYAHDPLEHLRHDFGNLPVYVVDDVGAEELDDGLSIEPIPSEPGATWIHVHVADPTAVIPPTHIFAQEARKMGFTAYFVHRTWPMLPKSLTLSKLSLGANSCSGHPEHVLTFSFKLDAKGNMVDYGVRAALVRNVVMVDYDSVDHLLGSVGSYGSLRPFDLSGHSPTSPVTSLSAEHINNLRLITEAISRHRQRNLASSNYFYTFLPKARITVSPKPLIGTSLDCPDPYRFRGFPSLAYEVIGQQMQSSGARMIISESMKAACRVASRWSLEHGVPMLRRSSKPPVCLGDPQAVQKLLAMRDPDGHVDFYAVQKSKLFIPSVEHTLEPAMHWSMGIPDREGYIRVTSPLRRYNDLLAHWQIKHALLNPQTKTSLFSPAWLEEYAPEIKKKEKEYKRAERLDADFWSHLYLKRFIENPHPESDRHDPLQFLKATISGVYSSTKIRILPCASGFTSHLSPLFSMSISSTLPAVGYVATVLESAQNYITNSPGRAILLVVVYSPFLAIILNILRQLIIPRNSSLPPEVFHFVPIFGSAISYGNDPLTFFAQCREKYGNVFTFVLLGRKVTVALGSKGNNFILGGKSTAFSAEEAYKHLTTPVFGKDVVYDCPNEVLMEQKKFVKVGLSVENFRAYVGMIENEVDHFTKTDPAFLIFQMNDINEWGRFDVADVMAQITILTASRTLQGIEVRESLDKSFSELFNDLDGGFTPINFLFPNLPLKSYRKRDEAHKKMSDFYISIIRKRKESGVDAQDMISALIGQKYRDGRELLDHEIAHILIALLMAGQHTSSATGSWALLHLADNQEVQEAFYQEQVKNFGNPDGSFRSMTYEELRELPVMDSVIRETLRLHSPIHSVMRYVRSDVPVPPTLAAPSKDGTYVVPRGYYVLASPSVSQVDPQIWFNADTWDPTRWSDPEGVAAQAFKSYSDETGEKIDYGFGAVSKGTESPYQPFGAGRHRCIGEQFAYLQLGTVLATLIRQVEVRLDQALPEHNYHTMITMPKKPRNVCYRRRAFD
ncbi:cytochrome P450 [Butyriboletus roseoflavus]|nr:cytochrome P450 [Butyriboletus roseoflavus]